MHRPHVPTLLSAFLTLLNDRLSESIVFPLLPFLLASFNADGRTLGLLAGSYALAQFAATPLIGALSDRFGRRPVIAICVSGSVLGLGLFAITLSHEWPAGAVLPLFLLFGARLIDGVSGGTAATAGAVLADITPPEKRARAFGLIGVAFGLGFIIGPFLGGQLARIAVTVPIWVATGFAVLNLVVVLTLLPETHPVSERRVLPRKRELNPFAQIARVIGNPAVGRLALGFFLFFSCLQWLHRNPGALFQATVQLGPRARYHGLFDCGGGCHRGPGWTDRSVGETFWGVETHADRSRVGDRRLLADPQHKSRTSQGRGVHSGGDLGQRHGSCHPKPSQPRVSASQQ